VPTVATSTEIVPGEMRHIDLQGAPVGVANVGGKFYAFTDVCTYLGCTLSQGRLDGMVITCSCGSQFDLASGRVLAGPAISRIRTYRVQVEGEELRI
jgi:3-phenylpropionate/trans-cinnamate dioxygenase ferredoxin subunit